MPQKIILIKFLLKICQNIQFLFYRANQENNPNDTDVNSSNNQLSVSPKKSIKTNNTCTNRFIDVTRTYFVPQSRFSVLNCDEVMKCIA